VRPAFVAGGAVATAGAVAAAVVLLAGGGTSRVEPKEDPGQVMRTVVADELFGQQAFTYRMLVREQRQAVSAGLYESCVPGQKAQPSDFTVAILSVRDEWYTVPALGKTKTKAVRYRMAFHDGTSPVVSTGHLIAEEGHWRWTLSPASFHSFSSGSCP
jgi:hypothetical protein